MPISEVSLQQILDAREERLDRQQQLLAAWGKPLVSFTMNIAGPVKRSGLADLAFRAGLARLETALGAALAGEVLDLPTGCEAQLVYDLPAELIKERCVRLEDSEVGRLYDLDVILPTGEKLSRETPRTCLVCGGPAAPCARSRAHGLEAVQAATKKRLSDFAADYLAELAVDTLITEVDLTPKPGLVDCNNNGAHTDMDRSMFHRSAKALLPYFRKAVVLGMEREDCMPSLQQAGIQAEKDMMYATEGVNTHRGAIYGFGLILAALGNRLTRGGDIFAHAAALAAAGEPSDKDSHGALAKRRYGAGGAREEALAGFPHARCACEVLREQEGDLLPALLTLLAEVEDTNLLHRGGSEGLKLVQEEARDILGGPAAEYIERLQTLDQTCIQMNLSPGGCADLLALGLLLYRTRVIWEEKPT